MCFFLHGIESHLFHWFWELGDIAEHGSLEDTAVLVVRTPLSKTSLPFPVITSFESLWSSHNCWNMGFQGNWQLERVVTSSYCTACLVTTFAHKGEIQSLTFSLWRVFWNRDSYFSRKEKNSERYLMKFNTKGIFLRKTDLIHFILKKSQCTLQYQGTSFKNGL